MVQLPQSWPHLKGGQFTVRRPITSQEQADHTVRRWITFHGRADQTSVRWPITQHRPTCIIYAHTPTRSTRRRDRCGSGGTGRSGEACAYGLTKRAHMRDAEPYGQALNLVLHSPSLCFLSFSPLSSSTTRQRHTTLSTTPHPSQQSLTGLRSFLHIPRRGGNRNQGNRPGRHHAGRSLSRFPLSLGGWRHRHPCTHISRAHNLVSLQMPDGDFVLDWRCVPDKLEDSGLDKKSVSGKDSVLSKHSG